MGCGASSQAPNKYSIAESPPGVASKEVAKDSSVSLTTSTNALSMPKQFETVFSSAGDAEGIADRVSDELRKVGYRLGQGHSALSNAASVVVCLSTDYFGSTRCCAELCMAVELQIPITFVVVEGASWNGKRQPDATDVPEDVTQGGTALRPRDAFGKAMAKSGDHMLEHSRTYFDAFVEELKAILGAPEASAQVKEAMDVREQSAKEIRESVARASQATSACQEERPVSVMVDLGQGGELVDGGLILVEPEMALTMLRKSLVEEHEDDDDDDEAIKLLGSGNFAFVRPEADEAESSSSKKVLRREEEGQWVATDLGEPIIVLAET